MDVIAKDSIEKDHSSYETYSEEIVNSTTTSCSLGSSEEESQDCDDPINCELDSDYSDRFILPSQTSLFQSESQQDETDEEGAEYEDKWLGDPYDSSNYTINLINGRLRVNQPNQEQTFTAVKPTILNTKRNFSGTTLACPNGTPEFFQVLINFLTKFSTSYQLILFVAFSAAFFYLASTTLFQ